MNARAKNPERLFSQDRLDNVQTLQIPDRQSPLQQAERPTQTGRDKTRARIGRCTPGSPAQLSAFRISDNFSNELARRPNICLRISSTPGSFVIFRLRS